MSRILLAGADVVLPGGIASGHTLVIEAGHITDVVPGAPRPGPVEIRVDCQGALIAPGFVDVHVHGAAGVDVLDGPGAVEKVATLLPRWGVTAFCPTTVACSPARLRTLCAEVGRLRGVPPPGTARVLPAHLESNFISPEYRGAQPLICLRRPSELAGPAAARPASDAADAFTAHEVMTEIDRHRPDIGIVTLASELEGGLDLVRRMSQAGIVVSLGHSGATFDETLAAVDAGARQVTHLFNRMRSMSHRDPGLTGAALATEELAAELICDGHHVHPSVMRVAIQAKGVSRVLAITDGTAGAGLPIGARAKLGGQTIVVGEVAKLEDGTMAGSVLTMDRAFATLVSHCGLTLLQAVELCSTTPARELGLQGHGVIVPGAVADLVLLNAQLNVVATWVAGSQVWPVSR